MALSEFTIYEIRTTGSNNNSGGFVWFPVRTSAYKLTLSASGTGEYYLEDIGGGDPGISACNDVYLDGWFNKATKGSAGSLTPEQWDFNDNDSLGYTTPYFRLANDSDPNTKGLNYIGIGKGGGIDYSRQASAALSASDFASSPAGTVITTASTLPANCQGNLWYVSDVGTGGIIGWYEILSRDSDTQFTIDRSCGASATGMAGAIGGARALQTDALLDFSVVAGNHVFFKGPGTFTSTENINVTKDGTPDKFIKIHGYNTTRGDAPAGTDRPLMAAGAFVFLFDNYYEFKHLKITGTGSIVIRADISSYYENLYVNNSSGTANRTAVSASGGNGTCIVDCEVESVNGTGISTTPGTDIINCIVHDSSKGILTSTGAGTTIKSSIVYNCTTSGIQAGGKGISIVNNTIDNCVIGINGATSGVCEIIKYNIISNCGTGISWLAKKEGIDIDWNCFYNNTIDFTKDFLKIRENNIALNPKYAGSPDFETGSNMDITIDYADGVNSSSFKIGAIQTAGAGGGGEISHGNVS